MSNALQELLSQLRLEATEQRGKGTAFENLALVYLQNDRTCQGYLDKVWTFADWAAEHGIKGNDAGIDLVASLREGEGFCAIQCKFYAEDRNIQRSDIDSFFTASGKKEFSQRLFIDTTAVPWSANAEEALKGQAIHCTRIGLRDLVASSLDWSRYLSDGTIEQHEVKTLRPDQNDALEAVKTGLASADRGKLIMACGTGKTFTSLRIAEQLAGKGGLVLFLVPSLALMSQTITEWSNDTNLSLRAFAACSDAKVGKRKSKANDSDSLSEDIMDLAYPTTTDAAKLAANFGTPAADKMNVVFSTYQSIDVIKNAQGEGLPEFDLIICDEAHRTTGVTFGEGNESHFVKVHDQETIKGKKRIYMTATPRIYGEGAKVKASENSVALCSMDDEDLFGKVFYKHSFSEAVERGLLTDYKVIVLAVDQQAVSQSVQMRLTDEDNKLGLDEASKIIGCYKALTKEGLGQDLTTDAQPMRRALAFCSGIKPSKLVTREFAGVVSEYQNMFGDDDASQLNCELNHVDGTFNAKSRGQLLDWLKEASPDDTCRILTNARCLSEGVDVPALDAIMFLHPRKSQIDVVQSVGRVMRKAEGKKMGYVILPVGIPSNMTPEEALNDNEQYKVVWQILNALRAHDDRFDANINRAEFGEDISNSIEIVCRVDDLPNRVMAKSTGTNLGNKGSGKDSGDGDPKGGTVTQRLPSQIPMFVDDFTKSMMARIVKKCGTREYWEKWAQGISEIAQNHITRITAITTVEGRERDAFLGFLEELRDDLNKSISEDDAIEMLAQHIITKPVFEALFNNSDFVAKNPVSKAMQSVLGALESQNLQKESVTLEKFYASVKRKASTIDSAQGRQALVVKLYDQFFKNAFPKTAERLGIVYTPVEVVDFIIHSVNDVLKDQFGQTLGSKGVHIIDPFTGTGTFVTRLLQSGLIKPEELKHKYTHEIHANEIVLLAYYIAAINIEAVYHELADEAAYQPFDGICLTDTFQLHEESKLLDGILADNSERRNKQRDLDIRVIIGNPPYSAGQKSANDNAANVAYETLDKSIADTYAKHSTATNKNALYDSYIRAIRWGSNQLAENKDKAGIIAFVSGSGWIERSFADGMRKAMTEEFSSLYVFHLRGDIRKNMLSKGKAGEGQNVFGQGSMTGVAISILVKNPAASEFGKIYFHDIGLDVSQADKLATIANFKSLAGIGNAKGWRTIKPDESNDWLNQRDTSFDRFMALGDKKGIERTTLFSNYSCGVKTQRDAWCYNSSKKEISLNITKTSRFYNSEVVRYLAVKNDTVVPQTEEFINFDTQQISWTRALKWDLEKGKLLVEGEGQKLVSAYRPFQKQWLHFSRRLNEMVYQIPRLFPNAEVQNKVIAVSGIGARAGFAAFMTNALPSLDMVEKGQCFPLYLYEDATKNEDAPALIQDDNTGRSDGISDAGLKHFLEAYPGEIIVKEDLFYYIYGLLHSPDYRTRFANNLSKQLPRIPPVKTATDFWAYSKAGRALGDLHVDYESVEPYAVTIEQGDLQLATIDDPEKFYRVEKMKFAGKRPNLDKTSVVYNSNITMTGIPLEAYDYVVNGKPALDWVMERQCVKTDKASGIVNDANRYAIETVGNPAYPLELFQRVITVSLETMKIVNALPTLDID